jgi:hypothetical protein
MAKLVGMLMVVWLTSMPIRANAHDAYDDSESHPLRLIAYAVHPVGWALEWLLTRPIHFVASQPQIEPVSGHVPHESPWGQYEPYEPADTPHEPAAP